MQNQFITVTISGQKYALELQSITRLLDTPELVEVPGGDESIAGIFLYQGKPVLAIDPAVTLHVETEAQLRGKLVFIDGTDKALLVDSIHEIIHDKDVHEPLSTMSNSIYGLLIIDDVTIGVLNCDIFKD